MRSKRFDRNFEQFEIRYLTSARQLAQDFLHIRNTEIIFKNRLYQIIHFAIRNNNFSTLFKAARLLVPLLSWCWHSRTHDAKSPEDYFARWQYNQIMSILFYTCLIQDKVEALKAMEQELKAEARPSIKRKMYLKRARKELQNFLSKHRPQLLIRIHRYQNTKGFHDIKTHVQFQNGKQLI